MIKKPINKKLLFGILMLLWMGLIFWFSSRTGTESEQSSMPIATALASFFKTSENINSTFYINLSTLEFMVRKSAHVFVFGILGFLATFYFNEFTKIKNYKFFFSVLLTLLYGISDEIHQFFVPGRACKLFDVFVDTIGGIIGATLVIIFLHFKNKKTNS